MKRRQALVIWGAGGHARVVHDAAVSSGAFNVVGFIDDWNPLTRDARLLDLPVFPSLEALGPRRGAKAMLIIAIGDGAVRRRKARIAEAGGMRLATVIHASAVVSPAAQIGHGTVVMPGVCVNAAARVGMHCILNTACSIDHDCTIGDGVHVGPGARLGGSVAIGNGAWIGLGASILDHLTIGKAAVVGAGSVVTRSLPANCTAFGVPARIRSRPSPP